MSPRELLAELSTILDDSFEWAASRRCVIVRSPAYYGKCEGGTLIEWEGSPPKVPIYLSSTMVICDQAVRGPKKNELVHQVVKEFLESHPHKNDPVMWLDPDDTGIRKQNYSAVELEKLHGFFEYIPSMEQHGGISHD